MTAADGAIAAAALFLLIITGYIYSLDKRVTELERLVGLLWADKEHNDKEVE
jgi:hypothetical protein